MNTLIIFALVIPMVWIAYKHEEKILGNQDSIWEPYEDEDWKN